MLKNVGFKLENDIETLILELRTILQLPIIKVEYILEEEPIRHLLQFSISDYGDLGRFYYNLYNRIEQKEDAVIKSTTWRGDTWENYIYDNKAMFYELLNSIACDSDFTIRPGSIYEIECYEKMNEEILQKRELLFKCDIRYIDDKWIVEIK